MKTALLYIITLGLYHFFRKADRQPQPHRPRRSRRTEPDPEPASDEGSEEPAAEEEEPAQ